MKSAFRLLLLISGLIAFGPPLLAREEDPAFWDEVRAGGHVILMRHALAPGTGDPANFTLGDCATQRNLSAEGRRQAKAIAARLRLKGIERARILSSQWCRCFETAQLLDLGPVSELALLNSFFAEPQRRDSQTRSLRRWLKEQALEGPLILVTHQVNIRALTGRYVTSGEMVVLRREANGDLTFAASLKPE